MIVTATLKYLKIIMWVLGYFASQEFIAMGRKVFYLKWINQSQWSNFLG